MASVEGGHPRGGTGSQLADAHQALGWFSMNKNWDWTAADASFKRALALEPRNVRALRSAAALAGAVGRFEEAIALGQRATELEPTNAQIYYNLCIHQRKGGDFDAALLSGRKALEPTRCSRRCGSSWAWSTWSRREPADGSASSSKKRIDIAGARLCHGIPHSAGRPSESDKQLQQLLANHQGTTRHGRLRRCTRAGDEKDTAFEWLDRAYAQRYRPGGTQGRTAVP